MYEHTLFNMDQLKEFHLVLYDGGENERHIFVDALTWSDALQQGREIAMKRGYLVPYHFYCLEQYD